MKINFMDYNEIFRDRTKRLAINIIKTLSTLKFSDEVSVIRKQIIRSSTSVAANYRAVGRSRSQKKRFAKMCIVVEEMDETLFWFEVIDELQWLDEEILKPLILESEELLKVMATYKKKITPQ